MTKQRWDYYSPNMIYTRKTILLLLLFSGVFAQTSDGIQSRENRFSWGFSAGPLSGIAGLSGRYWADKWGAQVTTFPLVMSEQPFNESSFLMGGVQILRRISDEPPRLHESSGYVHSLAYNYLGGSILVTNGSYAFSFLGGGFGLETFWRNWRFASGIGMTCLLIKHNKPSVYPSLDFTLSWGI